MNNVLSTLAVLGVSLGILLPNLGMASPIAVSTRSPFYSFSAAQDGITGMVSARVAGTVIAQEEDHRGSGRCAVSMCSTTTDEG